MSDEPSASEFFKIWRAEANGMISDDDQIRSIIVGSLDALSSLAQNKDLKYKAESMASERGIAFKYDTKDDPNFLRLFYYGIHEAIQKTIECVIAREEGTMQLPIVDPTSLAQQAQPQSAMATPRNTLQLVNNPHLIPAQQPNDMQIANEPKIECVIAKEEGTVQLPIVDPTSPAHQAQPQSAMATPRNTLELADNPLIIPAQQPNDMEIANEPETEVPLMNAAIANTPQPGNGIGGAIRRRSNKNDNKSRRRGGPLSAQSLNCPICTLTGLHVTGFYKHLKSAHNTTPLKEQLALKCTCGFVHYGLTAVWTHSTTCRTCSMSLVPIAR